MGGCTEECRQKYIKALEELSDAIKAHINLIKSLKKNEDGTLPSFYMGDVYACCEGNLDPRMNYNLNIQDLFNVNLQDLDFPNLKKGNSNEKQREENKN
ncbi:hypothetical protein DICPUDRAFT_42812 [Dictyostelium purpureum]|uniref:Uncharacterized protein n=1 Tax=Dictyostelium purpureum TaxID=5786 RepID=F1A2V2_DICPU|nr:uncharacterized protein DICPUDRAFT_42812 [Dictyostelium purpureum]EGC29483.1 hypothetical protein DICPUDRAFT_42812 [Dictyostelium purpureum]|eukprot:XP_003293992.1 hypothetical protein DICPUDRAFT_42812 [Dictyostelium purpureum]